MSSARPYPSKRLFKSSLLERLTHVHPILPILLWGPVAGYLAYRGVHAYGLDAGTFTWIALAGLLTWTLSEYALHRYAFHYKASSRLGQRLVYLMHGIHHEQADDPTRLVMPPGAAIILATLLFGFFRLLFQIGGRAELAEPFFAFFLVGYLCYDYIHYYVHHFQPKNAVGKYLKSHHMKHHYAVHGARWGVSSPLWDYVFGTIRERNKAS